MTDLPTQDLLTFTIATGKQDAWQQYIEGANDYSIGILAFASRWAHILESEITARYGLKGDRVLISIHINFRADAACSQADIDGITGGVEAAAVAILKCVWIYGDALNEWHRNQWGQE